MTVLLNNIPCLDPAALARDCAGLGIRTDWLGKPNSYHCPDGAQPGVAHLLLSLSALRRLDSTGIFPDAYDLEFQVGDQGGQTTRVKFPGLVVTDCQCVTPGARGDEAAYLLTLADRRHTDLKIIADVGFGLKHRFAAHDLPPPYSPGPGWQEAVNTLWDLLELEGTPAPPTLPLTPASLPTDLEYWQTPALMALEDLVGRCGCRLVYDPVEGTYRLVEAGAEDAGFAGALSRNNPRRIWDRYTRLAARARVPATVRVLFGKLPHVRGLDESPWHYVDVEDPEPESRPWSAETPQGVELLRDDLAALYDAFGALDNANECEARALQRAAAYFAELAALLDEQRLVFAGALTEAGFLPGPLVSATIWSDTGSQQLPGRGVITEVVRRGSPLAPGFGPRTIDPLTEIVRLTGETAIGPGEKILYGAKLNRWNQTSGDWVDRQDIWVIDAGKG
jgi:hypothetical protein